MGKIVVVNRETYSHSLVDGVDISIMRPSIFGNPFRIGQDGTRDECCSKHLSEWRHKLKRDPFLLRPLYGKRLVCCCAPLRCHGDNYILLIQEFLGLIAEKIDKGVADVHALYPDADATAAARAKLGVFMVRYAPEICAAARGDI